MDTSVIVTPIDGVITGTDFMMREFFICVFRCHGKKTCCPGDVGESKRGVSCRCEECFPAVFYEIEREDSEETEGDDVGSVS